MLVRYILKKNEKVCSHKNLHIDFQGSIIHDSQKGRTTQMFLNQWMDECPLITMESITMEYYPVIKAMKYSHMLQHWWIFRILCSLKGANHKSSHIVQFHLYEIPYIVKSKGESSFLSAKVMGRRNWGLTADGLAMSLEVMKSGVGGGRCRTLWIYYWLVQK